MGSIQLDLSHATGPFDLQWLNIEKCSWMDKTEVKGGDNLALDIPEEGKNWAAVLIK